jgi:hypothetical protein
MIFDHQAQGNSRAMLPGRAIRFAINYPSSPTAEKGQNMKMKLLGLMLLIPALLPIAACDTALSVGSRTIGIRSGEFIYTDGYLRTTYAFPLEKVWAACEKTLTDLKATDVERIKSIATGNFTAFIQDDKVRISVDYVERDITAVSIMAGPSGNNLASQLIHERIENVLRKP